MAPFEHWQQIGYKAWKLTSEDWRNREKWPHHTAAVEEMLRRTSTRGAPYLNRIIPYCGWRGISLKSAATSVLPYGVVKSSEGRFLNEGNECRQQVSRVPLLPARAEVARFSTAANAL